jgi:hypothetical protein
MTLIRAPQRQTKEGWALSLFSPKPFSKKLRGAIFIPFAAQQSHAGKEALAQARA